MRRLGIVLLTALLMLSTGLEAAGVETGRVPSSLSEAVPQDPSGNWVWNALDIQMAVNVVLGIPLDPAPLYLNPDRNRDGTPDHPADVNLDGSFNALDIQIAVNHVLGVI